MRIIGGELKGRSYSKKLPNNVRPTSELVRESLFNTLNNLIDFENVEVLDLCAGTGALGIESISRGAKFCKFIELNPKVSAIIKDACNSLGINKDKYKIITQNVVKFINQIDMDTGLNQYDLIFFDPPYFEDLYDNVINGIIEKKLLYNDGLFVVEISSNLNFKISNHFEILKNKKYGDTNIYIMELKVK